MPSPGPHTLHTASLSAHRRRVLWQIFYSTWTWDLCLLLGVVTSATDPVAVVALLRELGAKVSLSTTIEGDRWP